METFDLSCPILSIHRRFSIFDECAGRVHPLPEKDIRPKAKLFVSDLKLDIFCEEMYSCSFQTLVDDIREPRKN